MPHFDQRHGRILRTETSRTCKSISSGKSSGAKNRRKRREGQTDGLRDRFLQDQLLSECKEALQAKMVRPLQGAGLNPRPTALEQVEELGDPREMRFLEHHVNPF